MRAKIKSKQEVAKGTLRVAFDLLGERVTFQAGQVFYIELLNAPYQDEKGVKRHITIVNPPEDNTELVLTTRIRESAFKKSLAEMSVGSEVEVGDIEGDFILPEDTLRPLVFLAGGIGITPFMSMLGHIKNQNLPYKITLLYSNRDVESTPYFDQLQKWSQEIANFKLIMTMTQDPAWGGETRRIDAQFIRDHIKDLNTYTYYIAGPPRFVEGMEKVLEGIGVEKGNIKPEDFVGY